MSLPSSSPPAATVLDDVQRIFFVVPFFSAVLVILALSKGLRATRHAYIVYAYIASLAALSALAGALGSYAKAEAVVQNLLSLFCGYFVRDSYPHQKDIYDFVLTLI